MNTVRRLLQGQSLARIMMNDALAAHSISGRVADIGGGRSPDYFSYLTHTQVLSIEAVDGSLTNIDFERDSLPFAADSVTTVLLCNTLEHIFNYSFLVSECARVLASGGKLIGFVPFFVGYHPDPHDYFRYTPESLERILADAGFSAIKIETVGRGPFTANCNTLILSVPRIFRPVLYLWASFWDAVFLSVRPEARHRTPLGYLFTAYV